MGASLHRKDRELAVDAAATILAGMIAREGNGVLNVDVLPANLTQCSGIAVQLIRAVDRHMAPAERSRAKKGQR